MGVRNHPRPTEPGPPGAAGTRSRVRAGDAGVSTPFPSDPGVCLQPSPLPAPSNPGSHPFPLPKLRSLSPSCLFPLIQVEAQLQPIPTTRSPWSWGLTHPPLGPCYLVNGRRAEAPALGSSISRWACGSILPGSSWQSWGGAGPALPLSSECPPPPDSPASVPPASHLSLLKTQSLHKTQFLHWVMLGTPEWASELAARRTQ